MKFLNALNKHNPARNIISLGFFSGVYIIYKTTSNLFNGIATSEAHTL
jgi:hypothetical protein